MKAKLIVILCILLAVVYIAASAITFVGLEPRHKTCKVGEEVEYTLTVRTQGGGCFFVELSGINSSWVTGLPSRICVDNQKTVKFSITPSKVGQYSFVIRLSSHSMQSVVRASLNVVESKNYPPTSIAVTPDKFSPQPPGSVINWTASAYDPDGDELYYRFWLLKPGETQETMVRDWDTSNMWKWNTDGLQEGTYVIYVDVKDGKHEEIDRWVSFKYVLKSNHPPTSIAVTPDKFSPQPPGSVINWTASAYDPDGDELYYRFWLLKPGETQETMVRDWDTSNMWKWNTDGLQEGTYVIYVDVKDGKHEEIDRWVSFKYVLLYS